jgi:hypothetical protein
MPIPDLLSELGIIPSFSKVLRDNPPGMLVKIS